MPSPGETRLMCREVRRWRVVGGEALRGGRWIGRSGSKRQGVGLAPPMQGKLQFMDHRQGRTMQHGSRPSLSTDTRTRGLTVGTVGLGENDGLRDYLSASTM